MSSGDLQSLIGAALPSKPDEHVPTEQELWETTYEEPLGEHPPLHPPMTGQCLWCGGRDVAGHACGRRVVSR